MTQEASEEQTIRELQELFGRSRTRVAESSSAISQSQQQATPMSIEKAREIFWYYTRT